MSNPSCSDYVYALSDLCLTRIKPTVMESMMFWVVPFELMVVDVMELALLRCDGRVKDFWLEMQWTPCH